MPLIFVYGTLKAGFPNAHLNAGVRLPGACRTYLPLPLFLLGDGRVPCLVLSPGQGLRVLGEVYDVDESTLAIMDRLERVGEPVGYERQYIDVEREHEGAREIVRVQTYVKTPDRIEPDSVRVGPLADYTARHAHGFSW